MTETSTIARLLGCLLFASAVTGCVASSGVESRPERSGSALLVFTGTIHPGDHRRVVDALSHSATRPDTLLFRDVVGGDYAAGAAIARLAREAGLRTVIAGECQSACAIAFLGGVERMFSDENLREPLRDRIMIHGVYEANGTLRHDALPGLRALLRQMIGDRYDDALFERATAAPYDAGGLVLFDGSRVAFRDGGGSSFLCARSGHTIHNIEACQRIDRDAIRLGVLTTRTLHTSRADRR
jgi:hypothetical protein